MIFTRLLSLILRFGEFAFAAVVLGIMSYELHLHHKSGAGDGEPFGREVYTEILAVVSLLLSLVWMLPFAHNMMHYPADFILSAGWFAAFAVLLNWLHKTDCGSAFAWAGIQHLHDECTRWRASEAFAFLAAIFWFASFVLGLMVHHRYVGQGTAAVAPRRRRWGRRAV